MPIAVPLPALSPTMHEGKILRWLKREGDFLSSGTAIAECETDKSNLEIEAYDDGVLLKIVVPEGGSAAVGATIAWIGKPGEHIPETQAPKTAVQPVAPVPPVVPSVPTPKSTPAVSPVLDTRLRASPLAKKMASSEGIDLSSIQGTGPAGRVVKSDVVRAASSKRMPSDRLPVAPQNLPVSAMRRVIAQRLSEVKPGVPHFYLSIDVDMEHALQLREEAKADNLKVSINDIIVKATATALRRFPRLNQAYAGDVIWQFTQVDVGVAVAIEDGLVTPVVRDADCKSLGAISAEVRALSERARTKRLTPQEYAGGSITVSNLGMFGVERFIAILNPPQAAILAVGEVKPQVVALNGEVAIRKRMSVTLSGDHRVIDGAVGAQYLQELKALLEHPLRLIF